MKKYLFIAFIALYSIVQSVYAGERCVVDSTAMAPYKKMTVVEDALAYHSIMKKYCPKTYLERQVSGYFPFFITNMYLFHKLPYDSCWSIGYTNEELINSYKNQFKGVDFEKYDKKVLAEMSKDPDLMQIKRSDFWEQIAIINKKYCNPNGWVLIEKALRDVHDSLGLDWDEMIFVKKNALAEHEMLVKEIFTNMREEVNPVYLK